MSLFRDVAKRSRAAGLAFENQPHEVFIFHAEPFSQALARRLKFSADDDPAKVKKDGAGRFD
ncbi:hypothetical protein DIM_01450 [Candidatus Denitrolinea symbiosum]|nr:hypothetical protein DIM_01450 [Candidatus Denitrolinea symbiosum]